MGRVCRSWAAQAGWFCACVVLSLVTATGSLAQGSSQTRVALVIGNSAYNHTAALPNPGNDAQDMTEALKRLGFRVIDGRDLTLRAMQAKLEDFARAARTSDAALIFYAGHGLQNRGENYLVPVDAQLQDEISLDYQTLHIDELLKALDRAPGVRILVLDACRNLPLSGPRTSGSVRTGFAKFDARRNMVVAYATAANEVAFDGNGRNSFFTAALLREIEAPGVEVGQILRRVAADVSSQTGGKQVPEVSRTLTDEFYFARGETDAQAWGRIRGSSDVNDFKAFVERFPGSFLVEDARSRIVSIEREREVAEKLEKLSEAQERITEQARQAEERRASAALDGRAAGPPAPDGGAGRPSVQPATPGSGEPRRGERETQQAAEQAQLAAALAERDRLAEEERKLRLEFAAQQKAEQQRLARVRAEQAQIAAEERRLRADAAPRSKQAAAQPPSAKLDERLEEEERRLREEYLAAQAPGAPARLAEEPSAAAGFSSRSLGPSKGGAGSLVHRALVRTTQEELARVGCYAGPRDGLWTPEFRTALRAYLKAARRPDPDDAVSEDLVRDLLDRDGKIC